MRVIQRIILLCEGPRIILFYVQFMRQWMIFVSLDMNVFLILKFNRSILLNLTRSLRLSCIFASALWNL